jgi:ParB-like chromosome segregation protein Spo0J
MHAKASTESAVRVEALGERLGALRLCDASALGQMEQSLRRSGQVCAIVVFSPVPGELEVVDGFKRLRAARALGWTELRAEVVAVDLAGAKIAISVLHARQGLSELEEAWLVRSLYREDRLSQPEIARRMGRDKSWVCRRLMIGEALDDTVQADVRLGLLSPSAAAAVARLPRCNQRPAAQVVIRNGMTCRQVTQLVDGLLGCGDESARAQLLEQWRVCAPPRAPRPARRARSAAEWLMTDVTALSRIGARLEARLLAQPLAAWGPQAAELASQGLSSLLAVLSALVRTITAAIAKESVHAAMEHTRGAVASGCYPASPVPLTPGYCSSAGDQPQHGS